MTNKSKLKLKKMNFLNQTRRINEMKENTKYIDKTKGKPNENIYRLARRGLRSQHI